MGRSQPKRTLEADSRRTRIHKLPVLEIPGPCIHQTSRMILSVIPVQISVQIRISSSPKVCCAVACVPFDVVFLFCGSSRIHSSFHSFFRCFLFTAFVCSTTGVKFSSVRPAGFSHSFVLTMVDGSRRYVTCYTQWYRVSTPTLAFCKLQIASNYMQSFSSPTPPVLPSALWLPRSIAVFSRYPIHRPLSNYLIQFCHGLPILNTSVLRSIAYQLHAARLGEPSVPERPLSSAGRRHRGSTHSLSSSSSSSSITATAASPGAVSGIPESETISSAASAASAASSSASSASSSAEESPVLTLYLPRQISSHGAPRISSSDYVCLFSRLEPANVIAVWNALLCEVSVIMTASDVRVLTPSIQVRSIPHRRFAFPFLIFFFCLVFSVFSSSSFRLFFRSMCV